ncbi:hypothetical protein J421_0818 [Gemmatirosa kalamazoonensis]|uniref:Uncharacterized protein n=1 Tax=Gemmatirosa kalamazoonensis TaxID=861299 RepID=W0RDG5_9BACT|nr:hypothetical protein [Gemmatirosa kalamazoonensis]AHG88355.1 hypothetical protein J421_0818 [Gemmatirosa kalamazoonensis]
MHPVRRTLFAAVCLAALATPAAARAQRDSATIEASRAMNLRLIGLMQSLQIAGSPELAAAINGLLSDTSAHMRMAPSRPATPADSARGMELVRAARAALAPYRDVAVAEREGYVKFLPWLPDQAMYHYNNVQNVFATVSSFDVTKPVSLLYRKDASGAMTLVGAMYAALPSATPDELDARLPLGLAHWHEHVDFCGPTPEGVRAGTQRVDGESLAGWLRITSRDECLAAGGRYVPRLFGWMSHVYLFAGDDPKAIWGGDDHDMMRMHHHD